MKKIYWHIGYPKTGTTFLQKLVFPKLDDINFIGRNLILPLSIEYLFNSILNILLPKNKRKYGRYFREYYLDRLAYDDVFDKKKFINKILKHIDSTKDNLVSNENLFDTVNLERTIDRIIIISKELGFDYEIIMTIREPSKIILSRYMHNMNNIPKADIYSLEDVLKFEDNKFCTPPQCKFHNKCYCNDKTNIHINDYNYELIIKRIENNLENKKLIIWNFEDLFKDLDRVLFSTFSINSKFNSLLKNKVNYRTKKDKENLKNFSNNTQILKKIDSILKYKCL